MQTYEKPARGYDSALCKFPHAGHAQIPRSTKLWVLFPTNLSSVFSIALFPEDFVTMHQLEVATGKIPVSDHDLRFIYHYCRPIKYIP